MTKSHRTKHSDALAAFVTRLTKEQEQAAPALPKVEFAAVRETALGALTERQQAMMRARLAGKTLDEISKDQSIFPESVTRENVRQMEWRALRAITRNADKAGQSGPAVRQSFEEALNQANPGRGRTH